jgi:hypothetical protein
MHGTHTGRWSSLEGQILQRVEHRPELRIPTQLQTSLLVLLTKTSSLKYKARGLRAAMS